MRRDRTTWDKTAYVPGIARATAGCGGGLAPSPAAPSLEEDKKGREAREPDTSPSSPEIVDRPYTPLMARLESRNLHLTMLERVDARAIETGAALDT